MSRYLVATALLLSASAGASSGPVLDDVADTLELVTSSSSATTYYAGYLDWAPTGETVASVSGAIAAATTTVLRAGAAATRRSVKSLYVANGGGAGLSNAVYLTIDRLTT